MDQYDEAIVYFKEHREEIFDAWLNPMTHPFGHLFKFLSSGRCITMCKGGYASVLTDLELEIANDVRVPFSGMRIKSSALEVFAEYQRKGDACDAARNLQQSESAFASAE